MRMGCMNMLFFFFLLSLRLSVFSELSPSQKTSMINLLDIINDQIYYDSWNAKTDPCSWEGVTCNAVNSYVTGLDLSDLDLNYSFISIACQIDTLEILDISFSSLPSLNEFVTICGKTQSLKSIKCQGCAISGQLPTFTKGLTKLESLDLSENFLNGSIGAQFNGLVALKSLDLSSNNFTGSIPGSLGKFKGLEKLDLSENNLRGRIPQQLANCKNLTTLDLSHNVLVGNIPQKLANCKNLTILDLSYNRMVGTVPNDMLLLLPNLKTVNLSHNRLVGTMSNDLLSQSNFNTVDLSYNKLVGVIPQNITSTLVRLSLGGNSLTGSIPPSISDLTNLEYLYLHDNYLNGSIPINISNMHMLTELKLHENHLSGEVPPMPRRLYALNLSNNLLEGDIPPSFVNLQFLKILDLSKNNINGTITALPVGVWMTSQLEYLDLSGNQFSGSIPQGIDYSLLSFLDLSYNLLSGPIPPELQRFSDEAFVGNLALCGPPLTTVCKVVEGRNMSSKHNETKSNHNFYIGLYVSIGLGFYLGFWGVCGTLVLKDAWRHAYFNWVDSIYNRTYVTVAIYVARYKRTAQT